MSDLSIHPVYLSARAAIVAPERAIPVTLYSVNKWLPRLGPERWCLIMLLRSLSIDSKRRSDGTKRVTCSWRQLAELLDVHEETIASWLKHQPIPKDKPWRRIIPSDDKAETLSLFIPRLRYAYETRNGKTRRTGFLLEVLMEDPVVPEDEASLYKQIELLQLQQGELGLETYRVTDDVSGDNLDLQELSVNSERQPKLESLYVNQSKAELRGEANPDHLGLHNDPVNPDLLGSQPDVKQQNSNSSSYVNPRKATLHSIKSENSGENVNELDILIQQLKQRNIRKNLRKDAFDPIILLTETLLDDDHFTAMLFKVLKVLYPERLDLYVAAVRAALDEAEIDSEVNRGAVFVRKLRDFADIAGIDLGLKRSSTNVAAKTGDGNPGSHHQFHESQSPIAPPSVTDAIWSETQLVLRRQMTQATYDAIIQGTMLLEVDDGQYVVGVHSEMAKEWLENRLRDIVQRALSSVIGASVKVNFKLLTGTHS